MIKRRITLALAIAGSLFTTANVEAADNGTMMQYFHWYVSGDGQHWNRTAQEVDDLAAKGITALWLPPAYKGGSVYDVGYGVYDFFDLGEFDQKGTVRTKYGNKQQYLKAIRAAHANGMQVYGDVVLNHKGSADQTEWVEAVRVARNNRNYEYGGNTWIQAWTKFDFPGRGNQYSSFKWRWYHFDAVDWAQNFGESSIFKFRGDGKGFDWEVDTENQNYDYLMYADIDFQHPEVRGELKWWGEWYTNETQVDGFRIDAVKHIQFDFFNEWLDHVRWKTGKDLFAVGEYWHNDVGRLHNYIDKTGDRMSLFDVPLQKNFYEASKGGGYYDMRNLMNNTLMQQRPWKAVTFVANHDTQPLQALERPVEDWFRPLAYAFILTRSEGYPNVFYADYYGADYWDKGKDGNDYHIIMNSHQWILDKLLYARKNHAYGQQHSYMDHWDVIGWTREGDAEHPKGMAVLMSDAGYGTKWMYTGHANTCYEDSTDHISFDVCTNNDGWAEFHTQGGKVSIWLQK
jgi:alpha-amylase